MLLAGRSATMAIRLPRKVILCAAVACYVVYFFQILVLQTAMLPLSSVKHPVSTSMTSRLSYFDTLIKNNKSYYSQDMVELKQFYSAKRNHPMKFEEQRDAPLFEDYQYKVETDCGRVAKGIVIVIHERHRARRTYGGSSFRIMSTSTSLRQTCSFDDYFNGTYVAFCLLDGAVCSNVTIYIMYVDYMAYTQKTHPLNKCVWTATVCARNCYSTTKTTQTAFPSASLQRRVELQNRMTWRSINDSLKLFIRDERSGKLQHYQPIGESNLCR